MVKSLLLQTGQGTDSKRFFLSGAFLTADLFFFTDVDFNIFFVCTAITERYHIFSLVQNKERDVFSVYFFAKSV